MSGSTDITWTWADLAFGASAWASGGVLILLLIVLFVAGVARVNRE